MERAEVLNVLWAVWSPEKKRKRKYIVGGCEVNMFRAPDSSVHDGVFVALDDFDVLNSEAEASNPAVWSPAFLPSVKSIVGHGSNGKGTEVELSS